MLLGVGWYIRVKVPESPDFEKVKEQAQEIKVPAMQVFKNHPRELLTIIFARAAENAWFYIASTFALAYTTTKLGIPRQDILFATICGAGLIMVMTPLCGHLSDKVGQRNMFMFGLLVCWSVGLLVCWSWHYIAIPFSPCWGPKTQYWFGRRLC